MALSQQTVRFATTQDQVRLAWAQCGAGSPPAMVKAANWITHLEYDWESPVWCHWVSFLCAHFQLLRYDERGCGLSRQDVEDVSSANWLPDLEAVVDTASPAEPFVLLGISQGACASIAYAVEHPEKVSHLVLYGRYVQGWALRENPDHVREYSALVEFAELAWGRPDPLYRRLFTKRFLPQGSEAQLQWFDDLAPREREILAKLVGGLTNTEIGKALFISEKTVRNQLARIFDKLGVVNRVQAIVFAKDHGFPGRRVRGPFGTLLEPRHRMQ